MDATLKLKGGAIKAKPLIRSFRYRFLKGILEPSKDGHRLSANGDMVMHDSSSQLWHEAFANIDFSLGKDGLSSIPFGLAGLFALAMSAAHFLSQPSASVNQAPAYAGQPDADASMPAFNNAQPACSMAETASSAGLAGDPQSMKNLVAHLEGTYKLPSPVAQKIVSTTIAVSREHDMDPFLALGIMASESSFNHKARSSYGAAGLMQIHAPSHQALLEEIGIRERDPKAVERILKSRVKLNVTAGIRIYKTYEKQYGSPVKALQAYNGARKDTSHRYARKVLAARQDLRRLAVPHGACA